MQLVENDLDLPPRVRTHGGIVANKLRNLADQFEQAIRNAAS